MKRSLTIMLLLTAVLLNGQDRTPEMKPEALEAVTIPVKTLSGDSFDRLLRLLDVFSKNARYAGDSQMKTIVVYAPKEVVAQIRHLVTDLDKPGSEVAIGRNIELTLTFLKCSVKPPAVPVVLPADIESVAKQLRAATQYKDIQIWDTMPLHVQEGKLATGTLSLPGSLPGNSVHPTGQVRVRADSVGQKNQSRYVRFGEMRVDFRIPVSAGTLPSGMINTQFTWQEVGINTAGDFMEGQKTVLGKVSGMEDESAIFVVVALKILD